MQWYNISSEGYKPVYGIYVDQRMSISTLDSEGEEDYNNQEKTYIRIMILKITGEQAFQINASAFTISPSQTDYVLQVSADGQSFSDLFAVSANQTRMITNVANGAFYRLKNNEGEVSINWKRECGSEASIPTEIRAVDSLPLMAEEGTVAATEDGVYQFKNGEWVAVGGGSGEGTVKTVNDVEPDENGNVAIDAHNVGTLNENEILAIRAECVEGFDSVVYWAQDTFATKEDLNGINNLLVNLLN